MATIAENIQTLRSIKSDIKNAIIQKGGSVTDAFGGYAQAITNLPSGGGGTENEDALVMRTLSVYSNDRVSMVGDGAFYGNKKLISVNLQNCSSVGEMTFYNCHLLSSIELSKCLSIGNSAFGNCSSLSSVNFPLCEYVGNWALQNCIKLINVQLPNCISAGNWAFNYCTSLTYISLPDCLYINGFTFYYCTSLISIYLPLCISISYQAFANCSKLAQVYLNSVSSVTTIQSNTFSNCPNLTSVYVPASLVDAFKTATNWSSISDKIVAYTEPTEPTKYPPLVYSAKSAGSTITVNGETVTLEQGDNITLDYPNEITSVIATDNTALTAIQIPNTVVSINDNAFGDCVALSEITIPDSVKSIGVGAFQCCIGLTSINIPSGVTSISMETFNGCSALASVTLPEGLTNIGSSTFMDCTSLTSITIPSTVTMIDFEAFNYCEALTDFNFNGTKAQWASITKGDDWNLNAAFTVVHCTDGDVSLEEPIQPIQHEYVDLGLPSGLKWAKCNIGAKKETDYGDYFMWGSTEPNNNTNCDWPTVPFNNSSHEYDSTYFNSVKDTVCPNGILAKEYDAAAQIMGGDWRMPTKAEFQELFNNTTNEWTQLNGVNGRKFTSKTDTTKYIFIPAAGNRSRKIFTLLGSTANVWSSSLNTSQPENAFRMYSGSDDVDVSSYLYRWVGESVRGVRK